MLRSQKNDPAVGEDAADCFLSLYDDRYGDASATFEHGHWWITTTSGAQFDAVDAAGAGSVGGWGFEEVTPPDEE